MKRFFFASLFTLSTLLTYSQLSYQSGATPPQEKDTTVNSSVRILIIPYEPKMHLSDADNQIAEYSEKNPREIRALFRTGLTDHLQASLLKMYPTHSMLANLTPEGMRALNEVYRYVSYSYDTVYPPVKPAVDSMQKGGHNFLALAKKNNKTTKPDADDLKYMNVKIINPLLISQLSEKFDANVVVFLSQVEIKTRFSECLDPSLNVYSRGFKLHYSVFDKNGKQLYGGIAKTTTSSETNELGVLSAQAFPLMAEQIRQTIQALNAKPTAMK